jgi:hypothetical protein
MVKFAGLIKSGGSPGAGRIQTMNPLKLIDATQPVMAIFNFVRRMTQFFVTNFSLTIHLFWCRCLG